MNYGVIYLHVTQGDKVDLLDLKDRTWVVANEKLTRIKGDPFHFRKIDEGICRVAIFHVMDGNIKFYTLIEDDHPPQFYLRDVEGTTILWEEANLLES